MLLLLRLWGNGTREMDNERSTQGTSAPLLPLLQRFQNIHNNKEEPIPDDQPEVRAANTGECGGEGVRDLTCYKCRRYKQREEVI